MDKKSRGQVAVKVAETLSGYYEARDYDVFYDHDSTKDNVGKITSWSGDRYSRDAELSQLDVAILPKGSDQALALIAIEETRYPQSPFGRFVWCPAGRAHQFS